MPSKTRSICIIGLAFFVTTHALADGTQAFRRTTRPGQPVEVAWHFSVDTKCRPAILVVTVTSPPAHGHVEISQSVRAAPKATVGESVCTGQQVEGQLVTYTPEPGFIGEDRFVYDRKLPTDVSHNTVTVRIRP